MIDKLTEDQEKKLSFYKDKWLNKIFKYELYNSIKEEDVHLKMKELYKFCGLEEPVVIFVDSPLSVQIAANIITQSENRVRNQVWSQITDQIWYQVIIPLRDQVRNQVENRVRNQVKDQVWNQVGSLVEDQNLKYFAFSSFINCSDFAWLSFYDFFINEFDIIKSNDKEKFNTIISFVDTSFMSIQLKDLCIVSRFPKLITKNSQYKPHNLNGFAIEFEDGYGQHYFNGVYIKPDLFEKLITKNYTFEDWTKESNEETKSLVLSFYEEKFGGEFVFRFLSKHLTEIDTYVDKKSKKYLEKTTKGMNLGVYTLFTGKINNFKVAYVRCYCPSTDRMFFLGVNDSYKSAKDAIASLCQIPVKLKNHLVSINRQGEIFSFNFDEIGTSMLKNNELTNFDFREVVSLTGDEYFAKIKFEY